MLSGSNPNPDVLILEFFVASLSFSRDYKEAVIALQTVIA
jgi:hypothetical protein